MARNLEQADRWTSSTSSSLCGNSHCAFPGSHNSRPSVIEHMHHRRAWQMTFLKVLSMEQPAFACSCPVFVCRFGGAFPDNQQAHTSSNVTSHPPTKLKSGPSLVKQEPRRSELPLFSFPTCLFATEMQGGVLLPDVLALKASLSWTSLPWMSGILHFHVWLNDSFTFCMGVMGEYSKEKSNQGNRKVLEGIVDNHSWSRILW